MKKALIIFAFFILLEYQAVFSAWQYSPVTGVGLIGLCLYLFLTGEKDYPLESKKTATAASAKAKMNGHEITVSVIYGAILLLSILLGGDFGTQLSLIMFITIIGITALSFSRISKSAGLQKPGESINLRATAMSSFTLPVIYLCAINFLLSVQIGQNAAYQSILFLSCLVLYASDRKNRVLAAQVKSGKIDRLELEHHLYHGWVKYWNFFLGIWYVLSLRVNGIIVPQQEYLLLFSFMALVFILGLRALNKFTATELVGILFFAAFLTVIDPLALHFSGNYLPVYLQALVICIAFDFGDTYFHNKNFSETPLHLWKQKAVIYLLAAVYIAQLSFLMGNPNFDLTRILGSLQRERVTFSSVLSSGADNGTQAQGKIDVIDTENASHARQ